MNQQLGLLDQIWLIAYQKTLSIPAQFPNNKYSGRHDTKGKSPDYPVFLVI
ncbi:hypothetical protein [Anabaena lutea]|uniref:hypothetical protein n=1 Tax=Anabaena lutea TaxID=212350 RepID=UPI0016825026|nr:hypothetical protein [Anabaena lutea]